MYSSTAAQGGWRGRRVFPPPPHYSEGSRRPLSNTCTWGGRKRFQNTKIYEGYYHSLIPRLVNCSMWLLREFGNEATLETFTVIQAGPVHDFIMTSLFIECTLHHTVYLLHCLSLALRTTLFMRTPPWMTSFCPSMKQSLHGGERPWGTTRVRGE